MQHLRIVGIDEDAENHRLILSDDAGEEFVLPVDQALRSAVGRPGQRSARPEAPAAGGTVRALSPREIQAHLRAGASVSDVVATSGLDTAYIQRYAGPVHAERAYVAQRARETEVAAASSAEAHRLSFGDAPATLEAMATTRMRSLGVRPGSAVWDAWRTPTGLWHVACWFEAPAQGADSAGQAPQRGTEEPARWSFAVESRHLEPLNEWAAALTSQPSNGPRRGSGRLAAVDAPFDVEDHSSRSRYARGGEALVSPLPEAPEPEAAPAEQPRPRQRGAAAEAGEGGEHENLLDVLRARRGQRLGADADADDRLALMLTRDEQPQTPPRLHALEEPDAPASPLDAADDDSDGGRDVGPGTGSGVVSDPGAGPAAGAQGSSAAEPQPGSPAGSAGSAEWPEEDPSKDAWGFSYAESPEPEASTPEDAAQPMSAAPEAGPLPSAVDRDQEQENASRRPRNSEASRKRGQARRPSMPKWDDILFGSRED